MSTELDQLKQQFPESIANRVKLQKKGSAWWGCCPFLDERKASFKVSEHNGIYVFKCFGCGKGGTVIDFLMESEHCSLPEAVKIAQQEMGGRRLFNPNRQNFPQPVSTGGDTLPNEQPPVKFTMKEHVEPWEKKLAESKEVQRWLADERFITMEVAREFHLGFRPNCPLLGGLDAIAIPTIWNVEVPGVKYRALHPTEDRKWAMERGSTTKILQYADRQTDVFQDVCFVVEGPLDALTLISHGYGAVAITSAGSVPNTLAISDYRRFKEGIELVKQRYAHIACVGDQPPDETIIAAGQPLPKGCEGLEAMLKLRNLIGPGADRYPLMCFAGYAKDVTDARRLDGEANFRKNIDFIAGCARTARKTPAFESPNEATARIARSLLLHSCLHRTKLTGAIHEHVRQLEKLAAPIDAGYPRFPDWVMEGTSLYENFASPVSGLSAKIPEFLWMPAVVQYTTHLFDRVSITERTRIPYGFQLHIIGEKRTTHKSSSVGLSMDYMYYAGVSKNDSAALDPDTVDGRVLIQTAGSLEGCGLRMTNLKTCRGLLYYDELKKLADKAGIDGSSVVSDLLSTADAGQWANRVKRQNESFSFAPHTYCLSLITCCPTETFQENWARFAGSATSGLNERSFFLLEPDEKKEQIRARDVDFREAAEKTKQLISAAFAQRSYRTTRDAENSLDEVASRLGVQWTSRLELLSLFFALDLGRSEIDLDCAKRAAALCEYGQQTATFLRPMDAKNGLAELQQKITRVLERRPNLHMRLRELKKAIHYERYGTDLVDKALGGLKKTIPPIIEISENGVTLLAED